MRAPLVGHPRPLNSPASTTRVGARPRADDGTLAGRATGDQDLGFGDLAVLGLERRYEIAERLEPAVAFHLGAERRVDPGTQA